MNRSIDHLFHLDEWVHFFPGLEQRHKILFLDLLHRVDDFGRPLNSQEMMRIDDLMSEAMKDVHRINAGKINFLDLLRGRGRVAQKLVGDYDEDFVVTFALGAQATNPEERRFPLPDTMVWFSKVITDHLRENVAMIGEDHIQSTNDTVVLIMTDSDRLYDLDQLTDLVSYDGINKSLVTEKVINAFKAFIRISKILKKVGKENTRLRFGPLESNALILGFGTGLKFQMKDGTLIDAKLTLVDILDFLYGKESVPSFEEYFQKWCLDYLISPAEVNRVGPYPFDLNLNYQRVENFPDEQNAARFNEFFVYRFRVMYDLANFILKLYSIGTDFNLERFPSLQTWKGKPRITLTEKMLDILPIMLACHNIRPYENELRFRNPLVPYYSRMGHLSDYDAYPKFTLDKIQGVTDDARDVLRSLFFDIVVLDNPWGYWRPQPEPIYFLRSKEEIERNFQSLNEKEKSDISPLDFKPFLCSMTDRFQGLPDIEFQGYLGLGKAVEIHSLLHLQYGNQDEYSIPTYIF